MRIRTVTDTQHFVRYFQPLIISFLVVLLCPYVRSQTIWRTVMIQGQEAPGTDGLAFRRIAVGGFNRWNGGRTVADFYLNDAGDVAFHAFLSGDGVDETNDEGIWVERAGVLSLVVREGDPLPGGEAATRLGEIRDWTFNSAGQVAFHGIVIGDSINGFNDEGIWSDRGGELVLVVREGEVTPGVEGGIFGSSCGPAGGRFPEPDPDCPEGERLPGTFSRLALDNDGRVVFHTMVRVEAADDAVSSIWHERSGSLQLVAMEGEPSPGTETAYGRIGQYASNNVGQVAFCEGEQGIWTNRSGEPSLFPEGFVRSLKLNDEGHIVILDEQQRIRSDRSGRLSVLVSRGVAAPGTPDGTDFRFFCEVSQNNAGSIVFRALLAGPGIVDGLNDRGIWSDRSGELALVARMGSPVPGVEGAEFGEASLGTLNDAGQIASLEYLVDGSRAVWISQPSGELSIVVRQGDTIELASGDSRTIAGLDLYHVTPRQFNNVGEFALWVVFTDGSEAILVNGENVVSVPFLRGDCDSDGDACSGVNDALTLLSWLFRGDTRPSCIAACDTDGNGEAELTDAVFGLDYCFSGTAPPPPPFPGCGPGTDNDASLGCAAPENCQ